MSGRSSVYGESVGEQQLTSARSEASSLAPSHGLPPDAAEADTDAPEPTEAETHSKQRLHSLRLQLLQHLTQALPRVQRVGGVRALPLMQLILALTSDLDLAVERDRLAFDALLQALIEQLDMKVRGGLQRRD